MENLHLDEQLLATRHTPQFVAAWRDVVADVFALRREGEFLRVPSLPFGATLSYLPILNCTDLTLEEGKRLAETAGERAYLVRVLDPRPRELREGDPVVLRIPLAGRTRDEIWTESLVSKCRNQVRKAERGDLELRSGSGAELLRDFHALLARTMHGYGTPVPPSTLFDAFTQNLGGVFYLAYAGEQPAAGIFVLHDAEMTWVPWAASNRELLPLCPNHLTYWNAITDAIEQGRALFCFGRSPYRRATWSFKRQWGVREVPLTLLSSRPLDVYHKYHLAQELWQRMPRAVVDLLGPRLCRYLADY